MGKAKIMLASEVAESVARDAERLRLPFATVIELVLRAFYSNNPDGIQLSAN